MATLTVPSSVNGTVLDPVLTTVVTDALSAAPFGFEDVVIYSHGWSTDADQAMIDYDRFSIGLARRILVEGVTQPFPAPPQPALELGIHWPSEITEDPASPLNDLQLFTFYTMEHRADAVGKNLVYSLIRLALAARGGDAPLRFLLLGHSFGCKVMCAALQDVKADIDCGTIPCSAQTRWRLALLEPATDCDNLEPGDIYGNVCAIPNLRLLITTSQGDRCLTQWYPDASRIANLFHGASPVSALGAVGPTQATVNAFGGVTNVAVPIGFSAAQAVAAAGALVVADLSPAHAARASATPPQFSGGICGSHSDIFFEEIYNLVGGFLYA